MEKQNKFKIIIPSYNNKDWVEANVASIINQTYKNYDVLYINDASTDTTLQDVSSIIKKYSLQNWSIVSNIENKKRGYNVSPYNKYIVEYIDSNEDIIVFVDGDDWLFDNDVLNKLNTFYNEHNSWMTYGGMYCYPSGNPGNPQNTPYDTNIHDNNLYRKDHWRASHLRTFKWHLYKQIKKDDMLYSKTGKYYFHAEDLATSFPCLEMCPKHKIGVINFPAYVFNETPSNRERGIERENEAGVELESEIRNQNSYNIIKHPLDTKNFVTCDIVGEGVQTLGLGNQLFSIAATLGLAIENKAIPVFNIQKPQLPYRDNIFRNLNDYSENQITGYYKEPAFHYNKIPYSPGLHLNGYFQSEKYFIEHRDNILDIFRMSNKDKEFIENNFGYLLKGTTVSLHIRRGDYTLPQYSSHHPVQTLDYYKNAMTYFDNDVNYLVFSDDIDWAKENLEGENLNFVTKTTIKGNDVMSTLDISKGGWPDYIEMYLMSMCDHNIIANSSFSWWGAWLNENKNKIVIAPSKWFGSGYQGVNDNDIIPKTWTRI